MNEETDCPLTPGFIRLLQLSVELGTTSDRKLADALSISQYTVRTQLKLIHSRPSRPGPFQVPGRVERARKRASRT